MNYALQINEPFDQGFKRILQEQLDAAVLALTSGGDPHAGIHNARRYLKLSRAVLRLFRFELGEKRFHRENQFLRDEAKELSFIRDLTAMLETLEQLREEYELAYQEKLPERLPVWLKVKREEFLAENAEVMASVAQNLSEKRDAIEPCRLSKLPIPKLLLGLQKVYRRGWKNSQLIKKYPIPHYVHHWRKRSKCLRYHMRLLQGAWPSFFGHIKSELHQLTDYLGDYNNFSVLLYHLPYEEISLDYRETIQLHSLIFQKQQDLLRSAELLGDKLYAEKPKDFTKRIGVYLSTWDEKGQTGVN